MAIDFMIMPMSRYLSGDYITPAMQAAWQQGIPYAIVGPQGRRECPPGQPLGGPDAPARRAALQPMLHEDLMALPPSVTAQLWDEASPVEPRFHRVDVTSYQALLEHAASGFALHSATTLYLPCPLDTVFEMSSPFERTIGSVQGALAELASNGWPSETHAARTTLTAALADAAASTVRSASS